MKTGWAPCMLQDDCRELSKWLSTRVDSRHVARQAAKEIEMSRAEKLARSSHEIVGDALVILRQNAAELRRLDAENAKLRAELEAIYSTEPVAMMHEAGNATYAGCNPRVPGYTIPLIPLPVRKS